MTDIVTSSPGPGAGVMHGCNTRERKADSYSLKRLEVAMRCFEGDDVVDEEEVDKVEA